MALLTAQQNATTLSFDESLFHDAMAWRSEAAHDHSRVLAQCFAGADHGPGVVGFTAQLEDEIWQEASSWKGYCQMLATTAASIGHGGCLRVLHELGGEAAASLAAADADGVTPARLASNNGNEGCLRALHELGGEAAASLAAVRRQQMPMAARPSTIDVN